MTSRDIELTHQFVQYIPDALAERVVYISLEYSTAVHRCLCGCGTEVVTPLSPTDWRLVFDGETVSLEPSIGSWSLPCRSHYFITRNRVRWAGSWSQDRIDEGRAFDRDAKARYFDERRTDAPAMAHEGSPQSDERSKGVPFWRRWLFERR